MLSVDGVSDFNALHSGKHSDEVQLCAFDFLVEGDEDLRRLLLHLRKNSLERLPARRAEGIFINPFERGEIGPHLFRAACRMGLEGPGVEAAGSAISGRQVEALKCKNKRHPATSRVMEALG